jgi:glycosyltransferase involved in cell wall biosynthesis
VPARESRPVAVAVIVPRRPSRVGAVDSQLMAAAHLARGFAEHVGPDRAILLTEEGESSADAVLESAVHAGPASTGRPLRRLPTFARVAAGDVQALRRRHRLRELSVRMPLGLVVQFHHRFQDVGLRLAEQHGCPLVLRVEALEVAEQRAWGLRGASRGRLVEVWGEQRLIRRADVVSPVSTPLAEALAASGIESERLLTIPNGIDHELFRPSEPVPSSVLERHGLAGRFLLGWVGSFRSYHGLDQVERIVTLLEERLPSATLCLMGDGPRRTALEQTRLRHPRSLCLLPATSQTQVPAWLSTFDVCVQLADPAAGAHYSPLKVLEYLACGRPVVAPDFTTTGTAAGEGETLLYPAADPERFVDAIVRLHDDDGLRSRLSAHGRQGALARGSWAAVAGRMLQVSRTPVSP